MSLTRTARRIGLPALLAAALAAPCSRSRLAPPRPGPRPAGLSLAELAAAGVPA